MHDTQAQLFDQLAATGKLYDYPQSSLDALNALVAQKGRLLDVGCGDGVLAASYDAGLQVGFDISPRCAALARGRGVRALVASASEPFPFEDGAFDTVYCVALLHHLHGAWDRIFDEMDRVLVEGGTLVVVEPDVRNALVRWTQAPGSPLRVVPYDNEPAIDPDDLIPQFERRGYAFTCTPIHIEAAQLTPSPFPMWNRLLKAPFVIALAFLNRNRPNKFAIVGRKGQRTR